MRHEQHLGKINVKPSGRLAAWRLIVVAGWLLAAMGYYGPWIHHATAALTLTGVDLGEFVKFLPGVLDGSTRVTRQIFYLPPLAVVAGVGLLIGSRQLQYPVVVRLLGLALAVPVSLQLLPPAWSPRSLVTAEFRLQALALGACWVLLGGFWLWRRLPGALTGLLSAGLAVVAGGMCAWQFLTVVPPIDSLYGRPPAVGWGFPTCLIGLACMAGAGMAVALLPPLRSKTT